MAGPRYLHLRGEIAFARFDHRTTTIHASDETIRLATSEELDAEPVDPSVFAEVLAARGGAAPVPCPPDGCVPGSVLLVDRTGDAFGLATSGGQSKDDGTWTPLSMEQSVFEPADPLAFGPSAPKAPAKLHDPRALARDPSGRLWLLERGERRILLLAEDDLRWLDTVPFPAGSDLIHLACAAGGVLAADAAEKALWFFPYGGEARKITAFSVALPPGAEPIATGGLGDFLVALYRLAAPLEWEAGKPEIRALVAVLPGDGEGAATVLGVPSLEDPLPLLVLPNGHLLLGEVSGPPGSPMRFSELAIPAPDATAPARRWLRTVATLGVRGFDGRALFLDACGVPAVTTKTGIRRLYSVAEIASVSEGQVETYALDSERYGCTWHRVFLEACLPPGTSIDVFARTSDELLRTPRDARPPAEGPAITPDGARFPMGSLTLDDVEGWGPVGVLDRRAAWADVPFPPAAPTGIETVEGLLKQPPGRYLWLRVVLRGAKRKTPAIAALRVTFPRPSVLDHLPAFWRNDPSSAKTMEETLALFEGFVTEVDQRIDALPRLFDPRSCPPETLDWLSSFLALSLDSRLSEEQRRALLREGAQLYRQRGTVPGLTRLLEIVTGGRVDLVESFRLRRRSVAILGDEAAILGGSLSIGDDPGSAAAHAHRFTVVVFQPRTDALAALVESAVERNKPAHTVHEICFVSAGLRVGVTSFVGLGTTLGDVDRTSPFVVDQSPLGTRSVLGVRGASVKLGTFLGGARIGKSTHLL